MELKEIPVEELSIGMYVSKLDRPWTETPFMFQGFVVTSEKQIDTLRKYCKQVFVDPEKQEQPAATRQASPAEVAKVRGNTVYKELASVEAEFPRAHKVFKQTTEIITQLPRTVEMGGVIDTPRAQEAAAQITDSVVRNPDAIALLVKIQQQASGMLNRAFGISVTMTIFGRFLQFSRESLEMLGLLGLLQDVGMLKLPKELVERGPINADEIELYRTHVQRSVEILTSTPGVPADLPGFVSLHHERYDGSGYPRGLRGEAIALPGLIAGLVDAFDTLTAPAPLGEHLTPANALSVLYKGRGKMFHAALVEQFIQCIGVFPVGSVVELNSGEVAVVIAQNEVRRLQPRVMVVQDAARNPIKPYKILDLMKEPKARPGEPYRIQRALEHETVKIDPREMFL
jgi:HD-GYP domain-containing protein (c-di-GMP phosphodiesterase class II)